MNVYYYEIEELPIIKTEPQLTQEDVELWMELFTKGR